MIQNIEISRLYPHPDNPRKDLGDLTELAESIKANGVLQNLTVIPQEPGPGFCPSCNLYIHGVGKCKKSHDETERAPCTKWESAGNFTVVIGHRRLAAAKKAGLTEVPCAITEMDRKEQIATMLLENMQRADLTVFEQAQGIQMMMNLGESVTSISDKTGFSESTVRRRVKLLELDAEKLKKATERGATLMDFAALERIQGLELRNKVLETIGTRNFEYQLKAALDQEKLEANKEKWRAALTRFATEITDRAGMRQVASYDVGNKDPEKDLVVPEDIGTTEYFFCMQYYYVSIHRAYETSDEQDEKQALYDAQNACELELKNLSERAYQLRREFIAQFPATKKNLLGIIRFYMRVKMNALKPYNHFSSNTFAELLNLINDNGDYEDLSFSAIEPEFIASPEHVFLCAAYSDIDDSRRNDYYSKAWQKWPEHQPNADLDELYAALQELGYQMSDEERALKDGTHELLHKGDPAQKGAEAV